MDALNALNPLNPLNPLQPLDAVQPAAAQPGGAHPGADERLKAQATGAAVKFEAFFIKQMISQMRAGTRALADEDSPENKRVNQDMLDLADGLVADALAQQRAFGIADLMLRQVLPAALGGATASFGADLSSGAAASPSPSKMESPTR